MKIWSLASNEKLEYLATLDLHSPVTELKLGGECPVGRSLHLMVSLRMALGLVPILRPTVPPTVSLPNAQCTSAMLFIFPGFKVYFEHCIFQEAFLLEYRPVLDPP